MLVFLSFFPFVVVLVVWNNSPVWLGGWRACFSLCSSWWLFLYFCFDFDLIVVFVGINSRSLRRYDSDDTTTRNTVVSFCCGRFLPLLSVLPYAIIFFVGCLPSCPHSKTSLVPWVYDYY